MLGVDKPELLEISSQRRILRVQLNALIKDHHVYTKCFFTKS